VTRLLFALVLSLQLVGCSKYKNLQVLSDDGLTKGMKAMADGLGVSCRTCHVKDANHLDDVAVKPEARKFIKAVLDAGADPDARAAALKPFLNAAKRDGLKDEAKFWSAFEHFQPK